MTANELLTSKEVAAILKCSTGHIYTLAKKKLLRGIDIGTVKERNLRFTTEEVERFLKDNLPQKVVKQKEM